MSAIHHSKVFARIVRSMDLEEYLGTRTQRMEITILTRASFSSNRVHLDLRFEERRIWVYNKEKEKKT